MWAAALKHLGCTFEVFHVHSYTRTSSYTPVGPSVFVYLRLGLCFVCSFVHFDLFVYLHSFVFP